VAGEEIFIYSKVPMPILVPTPPPVRWAWGGPAWSRPFMSIYCSAEVECVCVGSWTSTPLNVCMAHTGTTLQIQDCTENNELDSYLNRCFYTLIVEFS